MCAVGSSQTKCAGLNKALGAAKGPVILGLFLSALRLPAYRSPGLPGIVAIAYAIGGGVASILINEWKRFGSSTKNKWLKVEARAAPRYLYDDAPKSWAELKFNISSGLWLKWREARPLLYTSQCWYARALVTSMIESCEEMLMEGVTLPDRLLDALRRCLTESPPPYNPSGFGPTFGGAVL